MARKTRYCKRTWLNDADSPSTGSVVCFDGTVDYSDGEDECVYIEISDCRNKVRLHKVHEDTREDFVKKLTILRNEINAYIKHLKKSPQLTKLVKKISTSYGIVYVDENGERYHEKFIKKRPSRFIMC